MMDKRGRKKGTFKCKICGKYNHLGVVCTCQGIKPVDAPVVQEGGEKVV